MTSLFVLSNLGGNTINEVALDFWRAGRAREEIPLELLEQRLRLELQEAAGRSWACWGGSGQAAARLLLCSVPSNVCHTGLCLGEQTLAPGVVDNESPILGPCEPRGLQAPFSPEKGWGQEAAQPHRAVLRLLWGSRHLLV